MVDLEETLVLMKDEDPFRRWVSVKLLASLNSKLAAPHLIEALQDPDDSVKREAVCSLGALKDERAVLPISRLLKDDNWLIRLEAAWALGQIGSPDALDSLNEALYDRCEEVVQESALSLKSWGTLLF